jgi:hypothetical protein
MIRCARPHESESLNLAPTDFQWAPLNYGPTRERRRILITSHGFALNNNSAGPTPAFTSADDRPIHF